MSTIIPSIHAFITSHYDAHHGIVVSPISDNDYSLKDCIMMPDGRSYMLSIIMFNRSANISFGQYIDETKRPFTAEIFHEYAIPLPDTDDGIVDMVSTIIDRLMQAMIIIQDVHRDYAPVH
jgi:hypothetical protein